MAGTINVGTIQVGGLAELKKQLRDIKSEMLSATDPERMRELAEAAGELKDRIGDANEQVKVFASGSKFEQVSNSFGSLKDSLMSLDFEEASEKAKVFQKTVTSISPETISSGIKGLASTVATLGKTFVQFGVMLLTNPIFLLVAAITAIVVAIGALMNSLGLLKPIINAVGNFFKGLMSIINSVVDGIKSALDWLGLTDFAAEESAAAEKARAEEQRKRNEELKKQKEVIFNSEQTLMQRNIDLLKAQGKNTTELEKKKIQASINYQKEKLKEIELEIKNIEIYSQNSDLLDITKQQLAEGLNERKKNLGELKESVLDSENQLKIIDVNAKKESQERAEKSAEKQKEINNKYKEDRKKAIEEIRQLENDYRRSQLTEQERELEDIKIKYEEQIKAAKKYGVDTKTLCINDVSRIWV